MASAQELKQRQSDEIEALKSIYDSFQLIDSKRKVWRNVAPPVEFSILIQPQEDDLKALVHVTLRVLLSPSYPKTAAQVTLHDALGLSDAHVQELQKQLQATAQSLVPEEAIFQLADEASAYITQHHAIIQANTPSLIDQLGQRTAREEEANVARVSAEQKAQKEREIQEHRELLEEAARERQKLKEHRTAQQQHEQPHNQSSSNPQHIMMPSSVFPILQINGQSKQLTVVRGSQLGCNVIGDHFRGEALDTDFVQYPVRLHIVDFSKARSYYTTTPGLKKIAQLTEVLDQLRSLQNLPRVGQVYGYRLLNSAALLRLELVIEPMTTPLTELLAVAGRFREDRVLDIAEQVLTALRDLHQAGLQHRSLGVDRVYVLPTEPSKVKVVGASYEQMLHDLNRSNPFSDARADSVIIPDSWRCPELVEDPLIQSKAKDIWDFGVLLTTLLGSDFISSWPNPAIFLNSLESGPIKELLHRIFVPAKQRPTADALLKARHLWRLPENSARSFSSSLPLRKSSVDAPADPTSPALQSAQLDSSFFARAAPFWQPPAAQLESRSRYRAEFEEVEFLGRGGFGKVCKALNKLDRNFYAIKKIKLSADPEAEQKILREVTTWSRLSHPAIVRYHTAWVETETHSVDVSAALQQVEASVSRASSATDEVDEDPLAFNLDMLDDADFLSKRPETSSYPRIHFGNDSDESSRMASRAATPSLSVYPTTQGESTSVSNLLTADKAVRTLYIQMEFIQGVTLREAIDQGLSETETWSILNQILQAIVHFTSVNIIHRDLKPHNIFLDSDGQVKVGDFGLAVESRAAIDEAAKPANTSEVYPSSSDLTSGVGTSLYLSPEMVNSRQRSQIKDRSLVNRLDMYSLGIVFFEMVYPVKTRMERIRTLQNLRLPSIQFPPDWDGRPKEKLLVQKLLTHDPSLRPSAQELLQSDLLPAPRVDDTVAAVSRLVSQTRSPHRLTLLNALFTTSKKDDRINDYLFDHGSSAPLDINMHAAKMRLIPLFERRGAIELALDGLHPICSLYSVGEGRRPVKLLDHEGVVLQLPYDHTVPLCRKVARDSSLTRLKRYCIAPVYRQRDMTGGQPRAPIVASFDIGCAFFTLAAEAECIQLVDSVIDDFGIDGDFRHLVGHAGVVSYVLQDVTSEERRHALRILELHSSRNIEADAKLISELSKVSGISQKTLQLFSLFNTTYDLATDSDEITSLAAAHPKLQPFLRDIQAVASMTFSAGLKRHLIFHPLLVVNSHLHPKPSIYFQTSTKARKMTTIAVGGRYDAVADFFMPPDRPSVLHVVGVSFSMAQLSATVAMEQEAVLRALSNNKLDEHRYVSTRRCDVYVVSFTPDLEETRLAVVAELWNHGIKADLLYENDIAPPEQMIARRRLENLLFLVIVKQNQHVREQTVKVRNLIRSGEDEVPRAELVDYLREHIGELVRNESEGVPHATASEVGRRSTSSAQALLGEIHFLTPLQDTQRQKTQQQFMLKRSRNLIADKATLSVQSRLATINDQIPIFVVDLEEPAISLMAGSSRWIAPDSDVFKRLFDVTPHGKRAALQSLRDGIRQFCRENPSRQMVWLYFARTDKSFPLVVQ